MKKKLKVCAEGTFLVPDFTALEQGKLRFVGRYHEPSMGPNGAWIPLPNPVEIDYRAEYIQELKAGTLVAADLATAQLARVQFVSGKQF